ncbi:MAG: alpha-amylase family protein [Acidimicrobiia bacterium]
MIDPTLIDEALRTQLDAGPLADLGRFERDVFWDRVDVHLDDLVRPLRLLYPEPALPSLVADLLGIAARRHAERPEDLRRLDLRRQAEPDWFQQSSMVGYAAYADRFAGDLAGVADHIDHLRALGVTYLHLMPLLAAREGENDGGYAVADWDAVEPRLGTMADLERLAGRLRAAGISLCVDLVANHTADTHPWARAALAGDTRHLAYFRTFPDRDLPDRYELTLREIFPDTDPGNFTWRPEIHRWVWTTFHDYQWDLDYSNPVVLAEMTDVLLRLANRGAEVVRLDAVAFLWKELGTTCENLPQAHAILQVWHAVTRIAAPGVLLLAEAIVPIEETKPYLGVGEATGKESHLAYHHFFMVLLWSALAEGNARLLTAALERAGSIPRSTAWCTYVRSHDDIGWAITPADAGLVGLDDHAHRSFLADFYTGTFGGSFARGEVFQFNPRTDDRRVSGTTASLAGLETALETGDEAAVDLAIARIRLLHALAAAHGGIPLIWSGDELATTNDHGFRDDPSHAGDNRWIHRPAVDWSRAADRQDPSTPTGRVFTDLARIMSARAASPQLHAAADTLPVWTHNDAVFGLVRDSARGLVLVVGNVTAETQRLTARRLADLGFAGGADLLDGVPMPAGDLDLAPYEVRWLSPA